MNKLQTLNSTLSYNKLTVFNQQHNHFFPYN